MKLLDIHIGMVHSFYLTIYLQHIDKDVIKQLSRGFHYFNFPFRSLYDVKGCVIQSWPKSLASKTYQLLQRFLWDTGLLAIEI